MGREQQQLEKASSSYPSVCIRMLGNRLWEEESVAECKEGC